MAIRRTLAEFSDEIVAADLADNSVTTAKIADSQITAAKVAADVATQAELNTVSAAVDAVDTSTAMKPHIRTNVLYPGYNDKQFDGTTALAASTVGPNSSTITSSKYGSVQSDGRMYYYTDIKGSKPIKDPRIGAHFGSQRHKFKSIQLLEQETATHGSNVYSVDGREWLRAVGNYTQGNGDHGAYPTNDGSTVGFFEIVGYFSDANWIANNRTGTARGFVTSIDGGSDSSENTTFETTVDSPLGGRYVDRGSLASLNLPTTHSTSLGLHTLTVKENAASDTPQQYGIELIAQDTTSTATKSQIQIPSQNVVSAGKKFTVAGTPHYNPFAFAGDGTTAVAIGDTTSHGKVADGWTGSTATYFDSTLDTATSLGLSAWETGGDFYRPVNGGRVVKWVDSSGNIKTSVNMMPPTGTAIGNASDAALPTSHAWTTVYQPKLSSTTIDHSQAEVAKTFHWREFGNGAANAGTGSGTWADPSMLSGADNIAYVMDDGLTCLMADDVYNDATGEQKIIGNNDGAYIFVTFIGTGISIRTAHYGTGHHYIAQNLPYGTHIVKFHRAAATGDSSYPNYYVDGINLGTISNSTYGSFVDISFHQPKMPPIPENAVIIADYMLMADFVPQTAAGIDKISKGTRSCLISRDTYVGVGSHTLALNTAYQGGLVIYAGGAAGSDTTHQLRMPSFATNYVARGYQSDTRAKLFIESTDKDSSATKDNTGINGSYAHLTSDEVLGVQNWGVNSVSGQTYYQEGFDFAIPIHTSSHYQTFETPFLHELVGGDRNMEQTNLVVTPDGETWDEVTRNTSYIGASLVHGARDGGSVTTGNYIYDIWRGNTANDAGAPGRQQYYNKDFAIAYDRLICLVDGQYEITSRFYSDAADATIHLRINGAISDSIYNSGNNEQLPILWNCPLNRGDTVDITVTGGSVRGTADNQWSTGLMIKRI